MVGQLLVLLTPQFIYYVIPIAALLSALVTYGLLARSSELTVMKACGISLYRTALSVVVLSLGFSAVLFSLEQRLMASANRQAEVLDAQDPRTAAENAEPAQSPLGGGRRPGHLPLRALRPAAKRDARADDVHAASGPVGAGIGDVRAPGRLPRQRVGRRAGMDSRTSRPIPRRGQPIDRSPLPGMESPEYFTTEPPDAELMSVSELRRYIAELEPSGFNATPLKVELHRKLAFPFVTLVMTLLAVPFGISAGKHGALYGVGLGIVIALSYWILISAFVAIGKARPPDARARRMGAEHPRRRTRRLSVPARANLVRLASLRRNLLQGRDEVARENALPVALAQHPLRNLPGHRGLPALDLALARHHRDERPYPPLHEDRAFTLERVIRVLNRVGVHLQLARELAHGGKRILRLSAPRRRPTSAPRPRPGGRPGGVAGVNLEASAYGILAH